MNPIGWLTAFSMLVLSTIAAWAGGPITTPKEQFGFNLGDDYQLANYRQLTDYWRKLEAQSDRLKLEDIGLTAESRTMLMAIITSPENHEQLEEYRSISERLAKAEGLSEEEARSLAKEGKAVVWINGGIHATEVLGAQQLMEFVYQMVSGDDEETLRFLDDVILLAACANPDGLDLVADWYMKEPEPTRRSYRSLPRLYHKYIGHDNNRDFYLVSQPETENMARILYRVWFPQIAYDHHQTGPAGTVLFAPPFRDPFNYNLDPLIPMGIQLVGTAMHSRFIAEGKPGATMRSGARYSTWWNGGMRTTLYFHNMIGILTETIGSPNPMEIPLILDRQLPRNDLPDPIEPQTWHFRQSVEYSLTANRAILDMASRYRETLLYNIYRMGANSIERGSQDHWTVTPALLKAMEQLANAEGEEESSEARRSRSGRIDSEYFDKVMRDPARRDPRGYIIPSDQPDFLTAHKFVNSLFKNGIKILQATTAFRVGDRLYPSGSYVVPAAQPFRPFVMDMFEPQVHPDDFEYSGGPPIPPYDGAGWTLAYQMGVEFDRVLDGFEGPFEEVESLVNPVPGRVEGPAKSGYLLDHRINDSFVAINRLLASGREVYWLDSAISSFPSGAVFIPIQDGVEEQLDTIAQTTGLSFETLETSPDGAAYRLRPVRIALWDEYGGSMSSGWMRWLLEQFEFPFEVVYPQTFNDGALREKYDVIIFVDDSIQQSRRGRSSRGASGIDTEDIPEQYRNRLGAVTPEETVPHLREFLEAGGTILAIGDSAQLAFHLGLPVRDALQTTDSEGNKVRLPRDEFYVPGSILSCRVDTDHPLGYGLRQDTDVYFSNSPSFHLTPQAQLEGFRAVAWFDTDTPLRSGWAWGQQFLKDSIAVLEAPVREGKLILFGPEITFRAQPHGTFKFLFNAIYYGEAEYLRFP